MKTKIKIHENDSVTLNFSNMTGKNLVCLHGLVAAAAESEAKTKHSTRYADMLADFDKAMLKQEDRLVGWDHPKHRK